MGAAIQTQEATNAAIEQQRLALAAKPKVNRHVVVALAHLNKRRDALLANRAKLNKEIEELDAAILALG